MIHYPDQAVKALKTVVWAIVVGGAITRPLKLLSVFSQLLNRINKGNIEIKHKIL